MHAERRELGIDHALVGGVMARRWGLPQPLAAAIEHHHGDDVSDEAALVRLADMLAHYAQGAPIGPDQLLAVAPGRARPAGPARGALRASWPSARAQARDDALPPVGAGARGLETPGGRKGLQADCARARPLDQHGPTHLHNVYGKLGAVDRAQAVLIATERGWQSCAPSGAPKLVCEELTTVDHDHVEVPLCGPGARRTGTPWSASGAKPVPIAELSRRREIPLQFLEQLFATLRRSGVLHSQRGVKGGYTFGRDPSEVSVLEVVQLLDGIVEPEHDPGSEEASITRRAAVAALREVR